MLIPVQPKKPLDWFHNVGEPSLCIFVNAKSETPRYNCMDVLHITEFVTSTPVYVHGLSMTHQHCLSVAVYCQIAVDQLLTIIAIQEGHTCT